MDVVGVVVWVVVLGWLLSRQVRRRAIGRPAGGRRRRSGQAGGVLVAVGAVQLFAFARLHPLTASGVGILLLSFAFGLGLGVVRAHTVRIWYADGSLYRQGTWLTVLLWLVGTGGHLAFGELVAAPGAGSATMLLYLGLAVSVQTFFIRRRVRRYIAALRARREASAR
ncbi:MAG: hypothetical protein ACJ73S_21660 [Mycobacteriales bacterium]